MPSTKYNLFNIDESQGVNGVKGPVSFTSSNNSVNINTNTETGVIDLTATGTDGSSKNKVDFTFNNNGLILSSLGINSILVSIWLKMEQVFDNGGTISIGFDGNQEAITSQSEIDTLNVTDPHVLGYAYKSISAQDLKLFIYNAPTQGSGFVLVEVLSVS